MSDHKFPQNLRLKSYGLRLGISTRRWEDNIETDVARNRMGDCGLDFLIRDTDWLGTFVIRIVMGCGGRPTTDTITKNECLLPPLWTTL
jgi:hypothetical protein